MIKTANLTANTETSISGLGGAHCRINNNTAGTLYASAKSGVVPGGDDVTAIPAGRGDYVVGTQGTVYLLSSSGGSVQVEGTDVLNRPFDNAAVTGGVAVGNPVVMDGLQGGVPFSKIVVSGKNLIPYPYHTASGHTNNGVTFTINDDRTITANGTATAQADYYVKVNLPIKKGKYTLSGCPEGGKVDGKHYYTVQAFGDTLYVSGSGILDTGNGAEIDATEDFIIKRIMIRITKDTVCNNLIFRPQLEIGDTPTAYEPPITGRELTLNINGTEIAVTPDSNPYSVPDDIRQQDGLNTLTVSAGTLEVVGVRKNAAIKKIWEKLDELTTAVIVSTADLSE